MNTHLIIKRFTMVILTLGTLLSLIIAPAKAMKNEDLEGKNPSIASLQSQGPADPDELEAFLDNFFAKRMEENHIVGAAISIVKGGNLFFAKGYGYADIEKDIPVDPQQTIFHIGSNGKVFTWTAVMQLVEQGKLDLDTDINTYLDFRIPDTYPQPITLKHLMTHTSGFEDRWLGSVVSDANELTSSREWLISHMAARVYPPGIYAGYSNFNAMLAGYIVERVSGQSYDQYMQDQIFTPLGMTHSSAQSPIQAELRNNLSVGYEYSNGAFKMVPDYTAQPALLASGGHQMSVTDMARFMIAHLENGRYSDATIGEARILKENTARQMQTSLYTPDPRLLGMTYGLSDWSDNGQRTLGHTGYFTPMNSVLLLMPDQDLGIFVVTNGDAEDLTTQHFGFQRAFFDHYYPAAAVDPIQPPADFAERAGRFVGIYRFSSNPSTTAVKIMALMGLNTIEISAPGDDTLLFDYLGAEMRFVEVEPLYFRQVDGPFQIVFREDGRGRITHIFTDLIPQYSAVKLSWYETNSFNMVLLQGCILIFLSMIPVAAIQLFRYRRRSSNKEPSPRGARAASWIILGISVLNLLFIVGFGMFMFGSYSWSFISELHDVSMVVKIVMGLGVLAALLTVGALGCLILVWKNHYWGKFTRIYYTLVTFTAVAFAWFLNYWNLLGWRY